MAQLGIRFLNLTDLNHYSQVPYAQMTQGQDFDLWFQIVDVAQVLPVPYIPGGVAMRGASGTVLVSGIDGTSVVTVAIAGISFSQAFDTTLDNTVALIAGQINADIHASKLVTAISAAGLLTVTAPEGLGELGNNFALYAQISTGAGAVALSGNFLSGGTGAGVAPLRLEVLNINDACTVIRYAMQPFVGIDGTIWKVSLLSTDPIQAGTANIRATLIEGAQQSFAYAAGGLRIYSSQQNSTQPGAPSGPFGYAAQGN